MPIPTQQENAECLRLRNEARSAVRLQDFARAETMFNLGLESARKDFGENSSYFAVVLSDLAECYEAQGKEAQAEECFRKVRLLLKNVGR